jgi:hypothetical protein
VGMTGQFVLVGFIVGGAAAYVGRRAWRTWAVGKGKCGGGCGCTEAKQYTGDAPKREVLIAPAEIRMRRRQPGP